MDQTRARKGLAQPHAGDVSPSSEQYMACKMAKVTRRGEPGLWVHAYAREHMENPRWQYKTCIRSHISKNTQEKCNAPMHHHILVTVLHAQQHLHEVASRDALWEVLMIYDAIHELATNTQLHHNVVVWTIFKYFFELNLQQRNIAWVMNSEQGVNILSI
jgi:hypothetical protein